MAFVTIGVFIFHFQIQYIIIVTSSRLFGGAIPYAFKEAHLDSHS